MTSNTLLATLLTSILLIGATPAFAAKKSEPTPRPQPPIHLDGCGLPNAGPKTQPSEEHDSPTPKGRPGNF